ncbi:beta-1,3-galactosyltransferase 5-like [Gouania willdenowi]|uniref:Hexosyltransferase n=1 Tax=Gouania willdenowi TaxID=441366 RepID=A0A8C5DLR2_GOUWI|nr:beta-1,3-galactosyltransferase 5-like [Gouania willdenowi]
MANDGMLMIFCKGFTSCSIRHCLILLLFLGAVFFFYSTNIIEIRSHWSHYQLVRNQTGFLYYFHKSQNKSILSTVSSLSPTLPDAISVSSVTEVPPSDAVPHVSPGLYWVEYPYQYRFVINEPQKCQQENPFVVLMVPVAPKNRVARDTIRSTWGGERVVKGKVVTLLFLLGLQDKAKEEERGLTQESEEHRDLIQGDFIDCYKNLTIKTMVMLEWLYSHCPEAPYAMKIDSDMFLNVENLVGMLLKAPQTHYMTGLRACNFVVIRDPTSKWYLPEDVYPDPQYPCYILGLGYVLSSDLPRKLVEASRYIKVIYIEDVFLGLCMQYLQIPVTQHPNGYSFNVNPQSYRRCAFSSLVATTTDPQTDLVALWKDFKASGPVC